MQNILEQRLIVKDVSTPVHRFRLYITDTDGKETQSSFATSWERSVKAYSAHKQGYTVVATNWNETTDEWDDKTEAAITEGFNRAERSKKNLATPKVKDVKPAMPAHVADMVKAHAELVRIVGADARKNGMNDGNKQAVGMSAMQLLSHVGYTPQEIRELFQSYVKSLKAAEEPATA